MDGRVDLCGFGGAESGSVNAASDVACRGLTACDALHQARGGYSSYVHRTLVRFAFYTKRAYHSVAHNG